MKIANSEFDYVSNQYCLAKEWLKSIKKCKCKLDETSDDCKHIRKVLHKLYGHRIDKMWNETLKERFETFSKATGFKIPYSLQKELGC